MIQILLAEYLHMIIISTLTVGLSDKIDKNTLVLLHTKSSMHLPIEMINVSLAAFVM